MSFDTILEIAEAGCFERVASLPEFAAAMFGASDEVPFGTLRDFYEDYVTSGLPLATYTEQTAEVQ